MEIKVTVKQLFKDKADKKAYVDVVFDDAFIVHGISVYEKENKKFLVMPRRYWTNKQGKNMKRDLFHPANKEALSLLQEAVFAAYEEEAAKSESDDKEVKENV